MGRECFILEGHRVIPAPNLREWAVWMGTADRVVAKTMLFGSVEVSTVFIGLDHSFGNRVPLVFETMVFGSKLDEQMERYPTWQDAEAGHQRWVEKVERTEKLLRRLRNEGRGQCK